VCGTVQAARKRGASERQCQWVCPDRTCGAAQVSGGLRGPDGVGAIYGRARSGEESSTVDPGLVHKP